jgi:hypothetical protein
MVSYPGPRLDPRGHIRSLTEDRVAFSTGRDIQLVPPQSGPLLNFFIYPYVEVGGKTHPPTSIVNSFSYRDLK